MISKDRIDSLTSLFQSYYGYVTGVALRYAPSRDLADDMVQEVYLDFIVAATEKDLDLSRDIGTRFFAAIDDRQCDVHVVELNKPDVEPVLLPKQVNDGESEYGVWGALGSIDGGEAKSL